MPTLLFSIEYAKKKEKKGTVKFLKDETVVRNDMYKSHTVHVPSGEAPNSQSRPPAKRKEGVVRPITQGKLLRKGGPDVSVILVYAAQGLKLDTLHTRNRRLPQDRSLQLDHSLASQRPLL